MTFYLVETSFIERNGLDALKMENLNFQFRIKTNEEKAFIAFVGNRSLRDNQYFLVKVSFENVFELQLSGPDRPGSHANHVELYADNVTVHFKPISDNGR